MPEHIVVEPGLIESSQHINILISGKQGTNVDTIIFANINIPQKKIRLITIPRDLYYNSRKINSLYADFGMGEMMRQLSDIVGHRINYYILVDIFIFRDLIDLIGGVNVELSQDLVDPTYPVYINGQRQSLYYSAGRHHVNGIEALRIARSRYTTSDYSRGKRQQLILAGIKEKLNNFQLEDASSIPGLISTVLKKTETNISLSEAINWFISFREFELLTGQVLSTGNVLMSNRIPVSFHTSISVTICPEAGVSGPCVEKNAIYALEPKDKDWKYIKWFINQALNS